MDFGDDDVVGRGVESWELMGMGYGVEGSFGFRFSWVDGCLGSRFVVLRM